MAAFVTLNQRNMQRLARELGVQQALAREGDRLKSRAEGLSPVESGTYRRSFTTNSFLTDFGGFTRAMTTVVNEAPYAAAVEFGNARTVGRHPLGRALAEMAVR